jgi:hypothetical protein
MSQLLRALTATLLIVTGFACTTTGEKPLEASSSIEVIEEGGGDAGQAGALMDYEAPDGFSVKLPSVVEPRRDSVAIPNGGEVTVASWAATDESGVLYSVSIADYPAALVAKNRPEAFLNEGRQGVIAQLTNSKLIDEQPVTAQGYPGTAYTVASDNGEVKARNYLVGNRLYTQLLMYNPAIGAPKGQEFLDSLAFINPPAPLGGADAGTAAPAAGTDAGTKGAQ